MGAAGGARARRGRLSRHHEVLHVLLAAIAVTFIRRGVMAAWS
jgi:hypothetical protein